MPSFKRYAIWMIAASHATYHHHGDSSGCPPVWTDLAAELGTLFMENGTCSNSARSAIRLAFHDCFPGRCDGSIILADECWDREENKQMVDVCSTLGKIAEDWSLSTADVIQFGAAIGIASCRGGPITSFYAGREDSNNASSRNAVPKPNASAAAMVKLFSARNFSVTELVALTGAHTIGRKLDGTPFDKTIGKWDNSFYYDVTNGSAPGTIASDIHMSNSRETRKQWRAVGKTQKSFVDAFIPAMEKLSLMGSRKKDLVDCSGVVKEYARNK